MKKTIAVVLAAGLVAAFAFAADKEPGGPVDVEGLIARGLKAYKAGNNQEAIEALQQAVAAIQGKHQKGLESFLPAAPAGWEAGQVEGSSMGGTSDRGQTQNAVSISRKYTQKGSEDGPTVTVTILGLKEVIETHRKMAETYKNPEFAAMIAASGNKISFIDKSGWTGWKLIAAESKEATISASCGDLMLTVQINRADGKTLDLFWSAIDLKGLAGAAAKSGK